MDVTILGVLGVLVIVVVSALAPRVGVAAPLALVAAGVVLSMVPGVPRAEVEPELILAGVLPPLLYASAVNLPAMDFRRDLKTIGGLSIIAVVMSAAAIGAVVAWLVPGLGFAEGFALGAIVSPTDAVATSIVKKTGVAPRLVTMLEGESLINDASALVLLRSAVAATGLAGAQLSALDIGVDLVQAIVVAVLVGTVVAGASLALRAKVQDATLQTAVSFIVPFVAYQPAEHLGGSGLVAVVAAGLMTGYRSTIELRPQDRLAEALNWRTVAFLLESGVFLLMGMELLPLVDEFSDEDGDVRRLALVVAVCLVTLMVVRTLYVVYVLFDLRHDLHEMRKAIPRFKRFQEMLEGGEMQRLSERRRARVTAAVDRRWSDMRFYRDQSLTRKDGYVLVWAGMRGAVTVAAAQTLPADFEQRTLVILAAFTVATISLLVQGGTLGWVVGRLGVEADRDDVVREQMIAIDETLTDVAASRLDEVVEEGLDGRVIDTRTVDQVRDRSRLDRGMSWAVGDDRVELIEQYKHLRRAVISDQRDALVEMRSRHAYDSEALEEMLDRLDAAELGIDALD